MGKEIEYKLEIPHSDLVARIMTDPYVTSRLEGTWQQTTMTTKYYDSPEGRFSKRHWTLRLRQEGERSVVCVKTPTPESHTRGEWQILAHEINDEAVSRLIEAGAPIELLYLYGAGDVEPVCGASFLRKHGMLRFQDGSCAELSCDEGQLLGKCQRIPLCELELELYGGDPEEMLALLHYLCDSYGLREQTKSKHARARNLK